MQQIIIGECILHPPVSFMLQMERPSFILLYTPALPTPVTGGSSSFMISGSRNETDAALENAATFEETILDDRLLDAIQLQIEGRYKEAIALYVEVLKEDKSFETRRYILAKL